MSAPEIRANYALLGITAHRFGLAAQKIQKMYSHLQRAAGRLGQGGWEGKGSEAFQREMQSVVLPAVGRLTKALTHSQATTSRIMAILREAEEDAARLFQSDPKSISAEGVKGDGGSGDSTVISGGSIGDNGIISGSSFGESDSDGKAFSVDGAIPKSDSWYQSHGYEKLEDRWFYVITDAAMSEEVLAEAGITLQGSAWTEQDKIDAAQGVADLTGRIGKGYDHLPLLTGGNVTFFKGEAWEDPRIIPLLIFNAAINTPAYALPSNYQGIPLGFDGNTVYFAPHDPAAVSRYIVVHEIAHLIDWEYDLFPNFPSGPPVTPYAANNDWEEWGESVAVWVYEQAYINHVGIDNVSDLEPDQEEYIEDALINPKIEDSKRKTTSRTGNVVGRVLSEDTRLK
jgi:WXG100 family type VII secretion target